MKTPKQIKKWLRSQRWYPQFVKNMKELRVTGLDYSILNGKWGQQTISAGFVWDMSPEGQDFWNDKDTQFLLWYHRKED